MFKDKLNLLPISKSLEPGYKIVNNMLVSFKFRLSVMAGPILEVIANVFTHLQLTPVQAKVDKFEVAL